MYEIEFKQNPGHECWMPFTTVTHVDEKLMEHLIDLRTKGHYFRFVKQESVDGALN